MELPINRISLRADARPIIQDTITGLVDSIAEVGLINPIRVRVSGEGWEVIAGAHRLEACKMLGLIEIAADVVEADDAHAELAMIDENLCRAELSPSDRARHTARRKVIYETMHPETERGANSGPNGQFVHTETESFVRQTSQATGKDERSVRRDAERGEKILPEVLDLIRGTALDTGAYMDKLKAMPGSQQFAAADRDVRIERSKERADTSKAKALQDAAKVRRKAVQAAAKIIVQYVPEAELDALVGFLMVAGKASDIAKEIETLR